MKMPSDAPSKRTDISRWWRVGLFGAAGLIIVSAVALDWAVRNVLPYAIVGTNRMARSLHYAGATPASVHLRADNFWCEAEPGLWLKGWFSYAADDARGTVFLLHGHNDCKESNLLLAKTLSERGFNCLFYDSRGCGESGGRFCTFGYYEHRDCSRCLDTLLKTYGSEVIGPVALCGSSFGGAVVLQTMADDPRFRCAVVASTFATLPEIVRDYTQHLSGMRLDALADAALKRAGILASFPPDQVRPEDAASRIHQPVLLIHGTSDREISFAYGQRIFRRLTDAPGSEWYPVAGGGHNDLWKVGGDEYRQRLVGFLERWDR